MATLLLSLAAAAMIIFMWSTLVGLERISDRLDNIAKILQHWNQEIRRRNTH